MKILLLEDDVILSEIIEEFLRDIGYEVVAIYDGIEAYDKIVSERFDLLLFDVNVPSLDGFELFKLLKEQNINIPTLFISSLNSASDVKRGFDLGAEDYLKKPFELVELEVRISHILKSKKATQEFANSEKLNKKELEIIQYLRENHNRIVSSDELITNLWVGSESPTDATIRTYIKNLRAKLGKESIISIKGVGYRINIS